MLQDSNFVALNIKGTVSVCKLTWLPKIQWMLVACGIGLQKLHVHKLDVDN